MKVYLLRHGETVYNAGRRYQGVHDIPLSEAGRAALRRADFDPDEVVVTPLSRTADTARILFPDARQVVEPGLAEMDFGAFEGRSAQEMEHDAAYRAWVDGMCLGRCPGGETRDEFSARVCKAFCARADAALAAGRERLVIVAHGGVQMAVLAEYAVPRRGYYDSLAPNGGGYVLQLDPVVWPRDRTFAVEDRVVYAGGRFENWEF